MNSIDTLAGGDVIKWNHVVRLPMQDVLIKMLMNQQQHQYEKKMAEIMERKAKRK
jgi:hypothetical protein